MCKGDTWEKEKDVRTAVKSRRDVAEEERQVVPSRVGSVATQQETQVQAV